MLVRIGAVCFVFFLSGAAEAHDAWADGKAVPGWVKQSCCGPADAHHLRPDQVHRVSEEFYTVDGYFNKIPARRRFRARTATTGFSIRTTRAEARPGFSAFSRR